MSVSSYLCRTSQPAWPQAHPPSSIEIFFMVPIALADNILPILVLPVKLTLRTSGLVVNSWPTA